VRTKLTEAKHVIKDKAKQLKQQEPEIWVSGHKYLCTYIKYVYTCLEYKYACMKHSYAYEPKNTVLRQQQNLACF